MKKIISLIVLAQIAFAAEPSANILESLVIFTVLLFPLLFMALWAGIMLLGLAGTIFWIMMLIDCAKRDESDFKMENGKLIWILILLFASLIGSVVYYFAVKKKAE